MFMLVLKVIFLLRNKHAECIINAQHPRTGCRDKNLIKAASARRSLRIARAVLTTCMRRYGFSIIREFRSSIDHYIIISSMRTDDMAEIPGASSIGEDEWSDDEFGGYTSGSECGETKDAAELETGDKCSLETDWNIPEYSSSPGYNYQCSDAVTPLEIFKVLLKDDILDQIVTQTNLYAKQFISSHPVTPHSRVHGWSRESFTREELQKFISLIIVMGLVNLPTLEDHWVTTWPYSSQTCSKVCKQCNRA